jgi:hypothetical protein
MTGDGRRQILGAGDSRYDDDLNGDEPGRTARHV